MSMAAHVSPVFRLLSLHEQRQKHASRLAHQVIQPITGMLTYSSNLVDGLYTDPKTILQKLIYIRAMSRTTARLAHGSLWVADAMDFSFLKKHPRLGRNLRQFIIERIVDMQPIREHDGISIMRQSDETLQRLGSFRCDELYFDQVVQNVIHNAVKYSYPGAEIKVRVESENHALIIDISSIGIPIEDNEKLSIFSDGERGKWAHHLDPNGTGQGLCICQQIMNGFGGGIYLLSSVPSLIKVFVPPGFPPAHANIFRIILPDAFK